VPCEESQKRAGEEEPFILVRGKREVPEVFLDQE